MNRFFTPNVDPVDHPDGHVLVVGDIAVMPSTDGKIIPAVGAQVALSVEMVSFSGSLFEDTPTFPAGSLAGS